MLRRFERSLVLGTLLFVSFTVQAGNGSTGMVERIVKAPVVADGDVVGEPTDYVIDLDRSLDPAVAGRSLSAGGSIRVHFPSAFDLSELGEFDLGDVFVTPGCSPGALNCTTAVLLQGWPQNPVPPPPFYRLSIEENTLVFTAIADIVANPPSFPGIKQIHLILNGVENPHAGTYRLFVEYQASPEAAVEQGSALLRVRGRSIPSINPTSVFASMLNSGECAGSGPPNPNTLFQQTTPGASAPLPWSFLLWGRDNQPLEDVRLIWRSAQRAWLVSGWRVIGKVSVHTPPGGGGFSLASADPECPQLLPAAPIIGAGTDAVGPQPVGRLDLRFTAGHAPGVYVTTLKLFGGNRVQHIVQVSD